MKKNIIKSLCALAVGFSVVSCENYDYNAENFEGYDPNAPITDVQSLEITLTDADYEAIAKNADIKALAELHGLSTELAAVATDYALSDKINAEEYLPAYLSALYDEYLDLGSNVNVIYNNSLVSSTSGYVISDYTVSADDYASVGTSSAFSEEYPASKHIPAILAAANPVAGTGEYIAVTYKYATTVASDNGGTEEPEDTTTYDNIGDIEEGNSYSVKGTVVGVTSKSFLVEDATGSVLVYLGTAPTYVVGDVVTIEGTASAYGGLCQFSSSAVVAKVGTESVSYPEPEVMDAAALDAYLTDISIKYVKYTGAMAVSGNYINITIDGATTAIGSISNAPEGLYDAELDGQEVDVYGYLIGVSSDKYVTTLATTIVAAGEELPEEPEDTTTYDNIGDIEEGNSYSVKGTVVGVTSKSFLVEDATGSVLVYLGTAPTYVVGDVVTIEGTASAYGGLCQFSSSAVVAKVGTESVSYPEPEVMDAAALDAYLTDISIKYVKYTGAMAVSGNYINITIDGATTAIGSISNAPEGLYDAELDGQEVDVYGYLIGVSSDKYVTTLATTIVAAGTAVSAPMRAAATTYETLTAVYLYDGDEWVTPDNTISLSDADYTAMGSTYGNLSNDQPELFIPKYLEINYPYAVEEDYLDVFYKYYSNYVTEFEATRYEYINGAWSMEPSTEPAEALFNLEASGWVMDKMTYLTLSSNPGMTESYDDAYITETPVPFTVEGVTFEYTFSYYNASYGSFYILKELGGYIANTTAMVGLSQVIVTEDYYYNITLSSGSSADAVDNVVEYKNDGDLYIYDIPEGHSYVKFTNESGYNASADQIQFIYKSL